MRNFLTAEDADFAAICEYTKPGQVTASRSRFFHRSRRIMLYTERAHFYGRHSIRGVKVSRVVTPGRAVRSVVQPLHQRFTVLKQEACKRQVSGSLMLCWLTPMTGCQGLCAASLSDRFGS